MVSVASFTTYWIRSAVIFLHAMAIVLEYHPVGNAAFGCGEMLSDVRLYFSSFGTSNKRSLVHFIFIASNSRDIIHYCFHHNYNVCRELPVFIQSISIT